ncbi:hypothetical protein B5F37_05540 [Drancourtella sp. An210]|nr:hypothetical protein [uncultured Sellimonas sp.]OUP01959.1 hypothetical protein B5F37_05540 [Drancourtella sp. An210]
MSKKLMKWIMLTFTICFLLLGAIFKSTAEDHKGLSASTGAIINGKFVEMSSGRIGANAEKYEAFNNSGTMFYILSGVTGVIFVAMLVMDKKSK